MNENEQIQSLLETYKNFLFAGLKLEAAYLSSEEGMLQNKLSDETIAEIHEVLDELQKMKFKTMLAILLREQMTDSDPHRPFGDLVLSDHVMEEINSNLKYLKVHQEQLNQKVLNEGGNLQFIENIKYYLVLEARLEMPIMLALPFELSEEKKTQINETLEKMRDVKGEIIYEAMKDLMAGVLNQNGGALEQIVDIKDLSKALDIFLS